MGGGEEYQGVENTYDYARKENRLGLRSSAQRTCLRASPFVGFVTPLFRRSDCETLGPLPPESGRGRGCETKLEYFEADGRSGAELNGAYYCRSSSPRGERSPRVHPPPPQPNPNQPNRLTVTPSSVTTEKEGAQEVCFPSVPRLPLRAAAEDGQRQGGGPGSLQIRVRMSWGGKSAGECPPPPFPTSRSTSRRVSVTAVFAIQSNTSLVCLSSLLCPVVPYYFTGDFVFDVWRGAVHSFFSVVS